MRAGPASNHQHAIPARAIEAPPALPERCRSRVAIFGVALAIEVGRTPEALARASPCRRVSGVARRYPTVSHDTAHAPYDGRARCAAPPGI